MLLCSAPPELQFLGARLLYATPVVKARLTENAAASELVRSILADPNVLTSAMHDRMLLASICMCVNASTFL